jgi:hypothetical protein
MPQLRVVIKEIDGITFTVSMLPPDKALEHWGNLVKLAAPSIKTIAEDPELGTLSATLFGPGDEGGGKVDGLDTEYLHDYAPDPTWENQEICGACAEPADHPYHTTPKPPGVADLGPFGPMLESLGFERVGAAGQAGLSLAARVLAAVAENWKSDAVQALARDLASVTRVKAEEGTERPLPAMYDNLFGGRIKLLLKWLAFATKAQYEDFIGA